MYTCHGCRMKISDQFILRVAPDLQWHTSCLCCSVCNKSLSDGPTCFMKHDKPYCKADYEKLFVIKCHGCNQVLDNNSLVMKSGSCIYHADCFNCTACAERLVPGDRFSVSLDGQLLCISESCARERTVVSDDCWSDGNSSESARKDSSLDIASSPLSRDATLRTDDSGTEAKTRTSSLSRKNLKDKPTRVRTVLNEKQLATLKRCYAANPRPDSVMKEQLVEMTSLSPRVIRVWFQNKRCKDKKKSILMNGNEGSSRDMLHSQLSLHSSPMSDEMSLPGCSPPLSSALTITASGQLGDHAVQSLQMTADEHNYRHPVSFPGYGLWSKYGNYQCSYQDSNSRYHQLVS